MSKNQHFITVTMLKTGRRRIIFSPSRQIHPRKYAKIKILPHCMFPIRIVKNSLHDPFIFIKKPTPCVPVPYEPLFEAFMLVEKIEAVQTSTKGIE